MTQGYWLRDLEVGKAGHEGFSMSLGLIQQRGFQRHQLLVQVVNLISDPQPEVGRDLIVPGPGGMEPSGGITRELAQAGFHVHMYIFKRRIDLQVAVLDFGLNLVQPLGYGRAVLAGNYSGRHQHATMGLGPGDILREQPLVKVN